MPGDAHKAGGAYRRAAPGATEAFRPSRGLPCDPMSDRAERLAQLEEYHRDQVSPCVRCPLSEGRTQVVVGSGDLDADLMFVGEAPGYHEDKQGVPFVGQAGKLLTGLIEGIGLSRDGVFIANVLKCRPPGNRDPQPLEISACEPHLYRQISLIRPTLVCTLGNFATKLLSGRPDGISRVHGHELPLVVAGEPVLLYPLFHPAAALYTRAMLATLEADFARIPGLLAAGAGPPVPEVPEPVAVGAAPLEGQAAEPSGQQLGLF
jgi:uracil-DNA glycosylase